MKKIAIIGATGKVGQAFTKMIEGYYEPILYSRKLGTKKNVNSAMLSVVCVPTPMNKNDFIEVDGMRIYRNDYSIVEEVVSWIETPVILIKSTIEPGITDYLSKKYKKRIVMSPEFVGEGKYSVSPRMDFQSDMKKCPWIILGGNKDDCNYIFDFLIPIIGPEKKLYRLK